MFVPATNIQFEVPEAFKDKQSLVPVGFPKIAALETIPIGLNTERITRIAAITEPGSVANAMYCIVGLSQSDECKQYCFDKNHDLVRESQSSQFKFSHILTGSREYWYQMRGVTLVVGGQKHTLQGYAHMTQEQNGQFWGDYLFFVSERGTLEAVEIKADGSKSQKTVTAYNEAGTIPKISKFEISPTGKKMLAVLSDGTITNGVDILPEFQTRLGQFKATESINLKGYGFAEAAFYNFQRLVSHEILALASEYDCKQFMVCLLTPDLEFKHMVIFKEPDNKPTFHKPQIIREDSWKGYPLIISARQMFEIDLFLIAKNQIMHLQTYASFTNQANLTDIDEFKSLCKVGEDWYLGGSSKQGFELLRRLVWNHHA